MATQNNKTPLILKLKAIIYKYSGLYLAYKEQSRYVDTEGYWQDFERLTKTKPRMSCENAHDLLIGLWQSHHRLVRPYYPLPPKFRKRLIVFPRLRRIAEWFGTLYLAIRWDIEKIAQTIFNFFKKARPKSGRSYHPKRPER
jgi:hypothetical protein